MIIGSIVDVWWFMFQTMYGTFDKKWLDDARIKKHRELNKESTNVDDILDDYYGMCHYEKDVGFCKDLRHINLELTYVLEDSCEYLQMANCKSIPGEWKWKCGRLEKGNFYFGISNDDENASTEGLEDIFQTIKSKTASDKLLKISII